MAKSSVSEGGVTTIKDYGANPKFKSHNPNRVRALQAFVAKAPVSKVSVTKIKDYGANPVFSAWSAIGGAKRNLSLPDIIHVDYTPITLAPSMNTAAVESTFVA